MANFELVETPAFARWRADLRDSKAAAAIAARLVRFRNGLFGDAKGVGSGVSEARVDVGPGYRLYFLRRGGRMIVLLCGGDKATQDRDIVRAKRMAEELGP